MFSAIKDTIYSCYSSLTADLMVIGAPLAPQGATACQKCRFVARECLRRCGRLLCLVGNAIGLGLGMGLGALGVTVALVAASPWLGGAALLTMILSRCRGECTIGRGDAPLDDDELFKMLRELAGGTERCQTLTILNGADDDAPLPDDELLEALRRCRPVTLTLEGCRVDEGLSTALAHQGYLPLSDDPQATARRLTFVRARRRRKVTLRVRDEAHLLHKLDKLDAVPLLIDKLAVRPHDDAPFAAMDIDTLTQERLQQSLAAHRVRKLAWRIASDDPSPIASLSWAGAKGVSIGR